MPRPQAAEGLRNAVTQKPDLVINFYFSPVLFFRSTLSGCLAATPPPAATIGVE